MTIKHKLRRTIVSAAKRHLNLQERISYLGHPLTLIQEIGGSCRGIVHVGANTGQEFEAYRTAGLELVVYIEADPKIFDILHQRVSVDARHVAIQALCSDREGEIVDFNRASNDGQSSSMLQMGRHRTEYPDVRYLETVKLKTTTLDHLLCCETSIFDARKLDCLVLDVQGAEMKVMKGAEKTLDQCRFVFTEVSAGGLYIGDASFETIYDYLRLKDFRLLSMQVNEHQWGNALFGRP